MPKAARQADSRGAGSDKGVRFCEPTILSTGPTGSGGVRDSTRTSWMDMGTTPLLATRLVGPLFRSGHGGGEVLTSSVAAGAVDSGGERATTGSRCSPAWGPTQRHTPSSGAGVGYSKGLHGRT